MVEAWLSRRVLGFSASGIRRVFDLGAQLADPINLSIGQPDFDVPEGVRQAAIDAIQSRKNGYALSQGMPCLRDKLQAEVDAKYGHADREVFVTSGTSGGLMLALLALVNPGDEVIIFDPYFVMYDVLVQVAGGTSIFIDTYPSFQIDVERVAAAITPRTKAILFNSPVNPTGAVADAQTVRDLAELAARKNVALVSDEIYRSFNYDADFVSPADFNPDTLVVDGFSKSHGMPGWRVGFAHGPSAIMQQMIKLQQYSFVCAPHPFQWAAAAALDVDVAPHIDAYRKKRDLLYDGLEGHYEIVKPEGAFYMFPKAPWGTATEFVDEAITKHSLLIIPGNIFSQKDSHFRVSYAADDSVIERGIEVLRKLAAHRPS